MGREPIIYLDMDGVCCDFNKDALTIHNRMDLYNNTHYSLSDLMGISDKEFWEKISVYGENFWRGLEEYPWFKDLYNELSKIGNVYFLSAPTLDSNCVKGKLLWLQDHFGLNFKRYIFTKHKYLLAKPDNFLVDDFEEQFRGFLDAGGNAVLFPQSWNGNRDVEKKLEFVLSSITHGIEK